MSTYSFDEPKFTSAREKRKAKENNKQKHQNFTMLFNTTTPSNQISWIFLSRVVIKGKGKF